MDYQFDTSFKFALIRGSFANIRVEWTSQLGSLRQHASLCCWNLNGSHFPLPGPAKEELVKDCCRNLPSFQRRLLWLASVRPDRTSKRNCLHNPASKRPATGRILELRGIRRDFRDYLVIVSEERPNHSHPGSVAATAEVFVPAPVAEHANVPTGGRGATTSRKLDSVRIQNANDRKCPRIFANKINAGNYKTHCLLLFSFFFQATILHANGTPELTLSLPDSAGIVKLTFPPTPAIERADLYFRSPHSTQTESITPKAILILAPGRNGNGRDLIVKEEWTRFADAHQLILCGLCFSSPKDRIEDSYSNAHSSSGALLLSGIDRYLGASQPQNLPLLLYGFSAGARFTASFVDAHPDRVLTWCGYAVGRWEDLRSTDAAFPPGLVACGEWDAGCYHASLVHFQKGRKLGQPWMWLSLAEIGHQWSPDLNVFVRRFFAGMLDEPTRKQWISSAGYFDIDTRKPVSEAELKEWPIFATWLPDGELREQWMKVHHP